MALLATAAILRRNRGLRLVATAVALLTVVIREEFLPAHVRNVVWSMAQTGTASAEFKRGALDTLAFALATKKFTLAGGIMLAALALLAGRKR
jgi:hypothetical protein